MNIEKKQDGSKLILEVSGRLDTNTAPELEEALQAELDSAEELELDLSELEYISSAGLRVLLSAQKKMSSKGGMVVKHVGETVMEVFEVTGFSDILTIQ